jgi:hypothetical protein
MPDADPKYIWPRDSRKSLDAFGAAQLREQQLPIRIEDAKTFSITQ